MERDLKALSYAFLACARLWRLASKAGGRPCTHGLVQESGCAGSRLEFPFTFMCAEVVTLLGTAVCVGRFVVFSLISQVYLLLGVIMKPAWRSCGWTRECVHVSGSCRTTRRVAFPDLVTLADRALG